MWKLDVSRLPCPYALCCINAMKYNVNDYVQSSTEELSVQEYLKASVLSSA